MSLCPKQAKGVTGRVCRAPSRPNPLMLINGKEKADLAL